MQQIKRAAAEAFLHVCVCAFTVKKKKKMLRCSVLNILKKKKCKCQRFFKPLGFHLNFSFHFFSLAAILEENNSLWILLILALQKATWNLSFFSVVLFLFHFVSWLIDEQLEVQMTVEVSTGR